MDGNTALNIAQIEQHLRGEALKARVAVFSSLASTNTTAKQMAAEGAENGLVVIAERQSMGRGRLGRAFFSPDGTGLYMSLIVRRPMPPALSTRLTTAAAVAVSQAVEAVCSRRADIKWVNDIYLDGKKACGILTEGGISPDATLEYAVIGIGVNIAPPDGGFPPDIADIATAVFADANEARGMREVLAAEILNRLMPMLDDIRSPRILGEYRSRSLTVGRNVVVHRIGEQPRPAVALDVDGEFRLLVRYSDGTTAALDSGEVSVRIK